MSSCPLFQGITDALSGHLASAWQIPTGSRWAENFTDARDLLSMARMAPHALTTMEAMGTQVVHSCPTKLTFKWKA